MKNEAEVAKTIAVFKQNIQTAMNNRHTPAQGLALQFAERIVRISPTIFLLTNAGATIEAHTVCRLLLEHFFNFSALLHTEKHLDLLKEHSIGEPARQLKKIMQEQETFATLSPESAHLATQYLSHPDRENDPKSGLNWEQIARSGEAAGFYTLYKQYSFMYAHSTLASLIVPASDNEIEYLHETVWSVVNFSQLLLRSKLLDPNNT
jgi:hypothetical protein